VDNRDIESENDHELLSDAGTQDQDIDIDDSDMDSGSDAEDVLAATIEGLMDLEDNEEDDGEDRSEEEDESEEDEDDEDEDEEEDDDAQTGEIEQKKQEIAELKQAIQRKTRDLSTAPNAMLKVKLDNCALICRVDYLIRFSF
jgi:transcription initiation factor TFIID subunit 7